jgi:hypothetical protein
VWAGEENVQEQEKLDTRKMLENGDESHTSTAPKKSANSHFLGEKPAFCLPEVYSQMASTQAVQSNGGVLSLSKDSPVLHLGFRSN